MLKTLEESEGLDYKDLLTTLLRKKFITKTGIKFLEDELIVEVNEDTDTNHNAIDEGKFITSSEDDEDDGNFEKEPGNPVLEESGDYIGSLGEKITSQSETILRQTPPSVSQKRNFDKIQMQTKKNPSDSKKPKKANPILQNRGI